MRRLLALVGFVTILLPLVAVLVTPTVLPADPPAPAKATPEPADNSYCLVCHTNYEEEKLTSGHQPVGVGCAKCHGESVKHSGDEDGVTPPERMFAKADINAFCITCHAKDKLSKKDEHREFLAPDAEETCTECHGKDHRMKVRTRRWDKRTGKLVADDGVRMMSQQSTPAPNAELFARENLVAWCIVPFDAKKRGPEERAAMLERLGIRQLAYDWRAEHVPTFDAELEALQRHGIKLTAFWFPGSLNREAQAILDVLKRHNVRTQLWVMGGGGPVASAEQQEQRVAAEANRLRPIAEAAAKIGCTVELYNHGGWFGEPENQIAILQRLNLPNVGIVYNLHHGHDHLGRFAQLLPKMMPYLHALNLNGMTKDGDKRGQKILPLGQGDLDLELLRTIRASGYRGPIGILNHTGEDAEARLQDNLDGLEWLVSQLDGKSAGPKPQPRSWRPPTSR